MYDLADLSPLLSTIGRGDEAAFRTLYDQTRSQVFNTALSYVRQREDAEEITQDVYIEVFRSAGAFRGEASATTWLYQITVRKSLDWLRHQKRQKRFAFLTNLFDTNTGAILHYPADFGHPGIVLEQQENAAILFAAVNHLPDKQKTAYILARVEGLNNIETAEVMSISVGAVESLLTRATENLKKRLAMQYKTLNHP